MSNLSIIEREKIVKQKVSVLASGINTWFDNACRLAVSTSDNKKMNAIEERLSMIINSIKSRNYSDIHNILEADAIISDVENLRNITNNDTHYYLKNEEKNILNRAVSVREYVADRKNRLAFLLNEDKYKINSFKDINKIYMGIEDSLRNTGRKDVCSCLANEAACISRNLANMEFKEKESLMTIGRQIARDSVFKARKLSV